MKPDERNAPVHTERLYLRRITDDDADELLRLFGDPVATRFLHGTRDREEVLEWIGEVNMRYRRDGFSFYACIEKARHVLVGYCGLVLQKDVDGRDEKEVGYGLIRKYWSRGYAAEAAVACRDYGFETLGFDRVISLVRPENHASGKVARRNGMVVEKTVMRWGFLHHVYAVFNPGLSNGGNQEPRQHLRNTSGRK